jgi:hypothetical protein
MSDNTSMMMRLTLARSEAFLDECLKDSRWTSSRCPGLFCVGKKKRPCRGWPWDIRWMSHSAEWSNWSTKIT